MAPVTQQKAAASSAQSTNFAANQKSVGAVIRTPQALSRSSTMNMVFGNQLALAPSQQASSSKYSFGMMKPAPTA